MVRKYTNMTTDLWELSSGLPLDGATVAVTKAEFGYRNDIAAGVVYLNLTFAPEGGDDVVQSFSVGKGWEPAKKGAELIRGDGRKGKINDSTGYGKFITSALAAGGSDHLRASQGPFVAETWNGTKWLLGTVKENSTNPSTGVTKESTRLIAVEFLGAGENASVASATTSSSAPTLSVELVATLTEIAKGVESHDDFMAAAFEVEGVAGDSAAEEAVMATGKGSIWAKSQA